MNLSENLRRLRLSRDMTQAALAEALGVSDRAVSRWERGTACPDVALLTQLALVLEISADALLGVDPQRMQAEILSATAESTALLRSGQSRQAVALLREKSALYPNQPELMVYLARALLAIDTEEGAREALTLCRAADGKRMRLSTSFGCKQTMAQALLRLGKPEQAAQLIEDEMPAIFVSRELLLPRFVPPERATRIRRSNITLLAGWVISTLRTLSGHGEKPDYSRAADQIEAIIDSLDL